VRARWREGRRGRGKISALLASTRDDLGIAASCLLAALGTEPEEVDGSYVRAYVGAVWMAEAIRDLSLIRKGLSSGG
jgi:hypothetical protein